MDFHYLYVCDYGYYIYFIHIFSKHSLALATTLEL